MLDVIMNLRLYQYWRSRKNGSVSVDMKETVTFSGRYDKDTLDRFTPKSPGDQKVVQVSEEKFVYTLISYLVHKFQDGFTIVEEWSFLKIEGKPQIDSCCFKEFVQHYKKYMQ